MECEFFKKNRRPAMLLKRKRFCRQRPMQLVAATTVGYRRGVADTWGYPPNKMVGPSLFQTLVGVGMQLHLSLELSARLDVTTMPSRPPSANRPRMKVMSVPTKGNAPCRGRGPGRRVRVSVYLLAGMHGLCLLMDGRMYCVG